MMPMDKPDSACGATITATNHCGLVDLEIFLDLPIPADVAFGMGWNRLPTGQILLPEVEKPVEEPAAGTCCDQPGRRAVSSLKS